MRSFELGEFGRDVAGAEEAFADEDGIDTGGEEPPNIGGARDAGFGDERAARCADLGGEAFGRREVHLERREVAVVDADEGRPAGEGGLERGCAVGLGQDVHPQIGSKGGEVGHRFRGERLGNQKDGVGAGGAGFVKLDGGDQKILPEDGQVHGGADEPKMVESAAEEVAVREATDGIGAGVGVAAGDGRGIIGVDEDAGRGRTMFDLGDDADGIGHTARMGGGSAEGADEASRRRGAAGGGLEGGQAGREVGHFAAFDGQDFIENGRHGVSLRASRGSKPCLPVGRRAYYSTRRGVESTDKTRPPPRRAFRLKRGAGCPKMSVGFVNPPTERFQGTNEEHRVQTFSVKTSARVEMIDITAEVAGAVREEKVREGMAVVFVPHTTAAVTINENADPDVVRDIVAEMSQIVPFDDGYAHGEGNSAAHIKSCLFGPSLTILVSEGRPVLGTWQAIYFCEFDGPRRRTVHVAAR